VKFANFSAQVKVLSNVALGSNGGSFGIPQYTFFYFFIWKQIHLMIWLYLVNSEDKTNFYEKLQSI